MQHWIQRIRLQLCARNRERFTEVTVLQFGKACSSPTDCAATIQPVSLAEVLFRLPEITKLTGENATR